MESLSELANWLSQTRISGALQDTFWVVPMVQAVHILAIAALLTSAMMMNARLAGVVGRQEILSEAAQRYGGPIRVALGVLLASGIILVAAEPHRELENQLFLIKMVLVAVSAVLTLVTYRNVGVECFADLREGKRLVIVLMAAISTLLWLLIIFCGRWIAYVETLGA